MTRLRFLPPAALCLLALRAGAVNPTWPNPNASRADLALPQNWPDDPDYGYVAPGVCTSGPNMGKTVLRPQIGRWDLWGFYPPDTKDPCGDPTVQAWTLDETLVASERSTMQGSGMSEDVAWTVTPGDPRVILANPDCGILWGTPDVVNKFYLNEGELTPPQHADGTPCASYDCNGDGVFNVLDYTSGRGHDQPLISTVTDPRIFNYQCPGNPTCHGDSNGNGLLDPEDLIVIFSDGKDDDGNGYVDDICGWDFFWNDNDAFDDEHFGHGTDQAQDSAAEANNGIGSMGTCPGCMFLPIRVADSFVGEGDYLAEGIFYALGRGANVVQYGGGATIDNTPFVQRAIDAAYARGAVVIASAADETSLHHNQPGNWEHTLVAHAIMYDTGPQDATSFIRFNNCTNAGGHLAVSTPNTGCSSEAAGLTSGEAGLLVSAQLEYHPQDPPLTAAEMLQLLWMNVENIDVPGSADDPQLFPSNAGWSTWFGYGRNDSGAAAQAVQAGRVPPEIDVTAPKWFETFDPATQPKMGIYGHLAANRAPSYDFTISVAAGLDPAAGDFEVVESHDGITAPQDGWLATVDVTQLVPNVDGTSTDPNAFAATVLVQAVAHYGGTIGDVPGQFRKSFFVHHDPDLFAGFPVYLGVSGESSPHLVDLDGSGRDAIVMATSDGRVHALRYDGSELPGWPVVVAAPTGIHAANPTYTDSPVADGTAQAITSTVAVGSLAGDGTLDVVVGTWDGLLYAWDSGGNVLPGFPVSTDPTHWKSGLDDTATDVYVLGKGFFAAPTLYDLVGDGQLEIVAPAQDGWVYVWDRHGNPWPGFPVELVDPTGVMVNGTLQKQHTRLMASAAVGDLNGDGQLELVLGSSEAYGSNGCRAYAVWADGNNHAGGALLPGWPINPAGVTNNIDPVVAVGIPSMAALADLKKNGKDIVEIHGLGGTPMFYDGTGTLLGVGDQNSAGAQANSSDLPDLGDDASGSFGALEPNGGIDFVDGTVGFDFSVGGTKGGVRQAFDHQVNVWAVQNAIGPAPGPFTAEPEPGFPQKAQDYQFFMNYVIADVDGDGHNEVISGSGVYELTAFRRDGSQPTNWPKNTGGWIIATPAVGDIDGDGYLDVVTPTREGWLWAWHGHGLASQKIEWEGYHHDARNTGNYGTALPTRAGPPAVRVALEGGGCATGGGSTSWALLLLACFLFRGGRAKSGG